MSDQRLLLADAIARVLDLAVAGIEETIRDGEKPAELQRPRCDCASRTGKDHAQECSSLRSYGEAVSCARFEWQKAQRLRAALDGLVNAVAAEVAFHPDVARHRELHRAFEAARERLRLDQDGEYPGDDGLGF